MKKLISWGFKGVVTTYNVTVARGKLKRNRQLDALDTAMMPYIKYLRDKFFNRYNLPDNFKSDLQQDLWIKAYEMLLTFDSNRGNSFKTYLTTCLTNFVKKRLSVRYQREVIGIEQGELSDDCDIYHQGDYYVHGTRIQRKF